MRALSDSILPAGHYAARFRKSRLRLGRCSLLALGIGANSTIFSAADAPYRSPLSAPNRLVVIWNAFGQPDNFQSPPRRALIEA
jgi:hypothetical protein